MTDPTRAALEQAAHELDIAENALLCSSFHNAASRAKQAAMTARAALSQPEPDGMPRRVYINNPVQIAECGGPCWEGGPEACDCGALWRDQPEPAGLSDEELLELMPQQFRDDLATVSRMAAHGAGSDVGAGLFRVSLNTGALEFARAAIAADRAQRQPVPPEPGEVQELVRVLHQAAHNDKWDGASPEWCASLTRAAELLSQRHPQPVPISERLPGPDDCDAEGRCWLRRKYQPDGPTWRLTRPASISTEALRLYYAEWLPAHALPLPGEAVKEPPDNRDPECVANWPECWSGGYDPRCCRFPKRCSCERGALPLPGEVEG